MKMIRYAALLICMLWQQTAWSSNQWQYWMTDKGFLNRSLNELTLPGAHDAGMGIAENCSDYANSKVTQTQDKSFAQMLNAGIRYFDARPVILRDGEMYLGHFSWIGRDIDLKIPEPSDLLPVPDIPFFGSLPISSPLSSNAISLHKFTLRNEGCTGYTVSRMLDDVAAFLAGATREQKTEIVLLNFSHFMNLKSYDQKGSHFDSSDFTALMAQIRNKLGPYLIKKLPESGSLTHTPLKELTASKSRAIVLLDKGLEVAENGIYPSDIIDLYDEYSDKSSFADMEDDQINKLIQHAGQKYFVLSWTLTQNDDQAIGCMLPPHLIEAAGSYAPQLKKYRCKTIQQLAQMANKQLDDIPKEVIIHQKFPNVLYADFVSEQTTSTSYLINQARYKSAIDLKLASFGFDAGNWRSDKNPRMLADVNGDGLKDIIGFGNKGVYVSEAITGSNGRIYFKASSLWLDSFGYDAGNWRVDQNPRMMADVNGDGKADIIGFGNRGVYVSLSEGNRFTESSVWVNSFGIDAGDWRSDKYPRTVADVNGDGRADIIGFGSEGVLVSLSKGDRFSAPEYWVRSFGYNAGNWRVEKNPRLMADVNGDGRADIVGFGNKGVYVSLSKGSHFTESSIWAEGFGYDSGNWRTDKHPRMTADVNGDGRADIVGFGNQGVYVALSLGDRFSTSYLWVSDYGYKAGQWRTEENPRMMADINGDGLADVIGFGNQGVMTSESTGTHFKAPEMQVYNFGYDLIDWRVGRNPRLAEDINRDNRADLIGFGNNGVYMFQF